VDYKELYEKALAKNDEGIALYHAIAKGDEPIEKREQADALIAEAGELMEQAKALQKAEAQKAYLEEGLGSLTAGSDVDDHDGNGDPPKSEWKSLAEFAVSVAAMAIPSLRGTLEAKGVLPEDWEKKALAEALGASGGFLVPIAYRAELFQKAYEASIVRPRATVIPMTTRQIQMPSLDQTITPTAPLSAFFGGLVWYWTEEAAPKEEVDFEFKLIDLIVHKYAGWLPVSNELIADSAISLEALIRSQFGKCAVAYEDWHFLNGSGVGQPQGVIAAGATIQPNRQLANQISFTDITNIIHHFQPAANGVWVANICTMPQLLRMVDPNGNYMWIPNARDGMPERLMGYPLIFTEKVPALGTKGDIGLYDFSYYLIGDREQPTIDASREERFRYDQTTFRLSARVDGKPWLTAPIQIMPAGAHSISPFVDLDVPA